MPSESSLLSFSITVSLFLLHRDTLLKISSVATGSQSTARPVDVAGDKLGS